MQQIGKEELKWRIADVLMIYRTLLADISMYRRDPTDCIANTDIQQQHDSELPHMPGSLPMYKTNIEK